MFYLVSSDLLQRLDCDAISEGVAANKSLVEDGSDIEIKMSWLQKKPTHRQIMKGWC